MPVQEFKKMTPQEIDEVYNLDKDKGPDYVPYDPLVHGWRGEEPRRNFKPPVAQIDALVNKGHQSTSMDTSSVSTVGSEILLGESVQIDELELLAHGGRKRRFHSAIMRFFNCFRAD